MAGGNSNNQLFCPRPPQSVHSCAHGESTGEAVVDQNDFVREQIRHWPPFAECRDPPVDLGPGLVQATGNGALIQTKLSYHCFIEQGAAIKGNRPVTGFGVPGQSDFTDHSDVQWAVQGFGKRNGDRHPSGRYGKHQGMLQIKLFNQPGQHLSGLVSISKQAGPVTELFDLEDPSRLHSGFASQ